MSASKVQNLENHTRYVPGFHFVTGFLTIGVLVYSLYRFAVLRTPDSFVGVVMAGILMSLFWYLRAFPLAVQDRVIRLEERLRLARLAPPDLQARCDQLTASQLIALRFASDAELTALARKVLDERIADRKSIKRLIRDWRPDTMRA